MDRSARRLLQVMALGLLVSGWTMTAAAAPAQPPARAHYFPSSDPKSWRVDVPVSSSLPALARSPVFSTYLGGASHDFAFGIAVDAAGNTYVTGGSGSADFPRLAGLLNPPGGVFVVKLDPDGDLVFSTFLGGGDGAGYDIDLDPAGNIYLTGYAGRGFPLVNPLPPELRQGGDLQAFVAKLDPTGSHLLYSTTLSGPGQNEGRGIAVDAQGHAYVVGGTSNGIPVVNPPLPPAPEWSSFLVKLHPSGSSVVYSTLLSGYSWGVDTDPAGFVYVGGESWGGLPTVNAFQPAPAGGGDAFLLKLRPSGEPVYVTYFGGTSSETSGTVAADAAGNAYLTGTTDSLDLPLRNPLQSGLKLSYDAFVAKLGPSGALVYATYLGGTFQDAALGIGVDNQGRALITGWTQSIDFPLKDPVQAECRPVFDDFYCFPDAFVTQLSPAGDAIVFSTYLGGTDGYEEEGFAVAPGPGGSIHVAGATSTSDFPTFNAFQPAFGGGSMDGFAAKIGPPNRPPVCAAATPSPATIWPPNGLLVPVSIRGVTDPDGDPVSLTVTAVLQDEPLTGPPAAAGVGTPAAQVRAERLGGGDGRVYHLRFMATDGKGGQCAGEVKVCVPHDRRPGATCGDGGALHSSTGGR